MASAETGLSDLPRELYRLIITSGLSAQEVCQLSRCASTRAFAADALPPACRCCRAPSCQQVNLPPCRSSRALRAASEANSIWTELLQRDFPGGSTAAQLLEHRAAAVAAVAAAVPNGDSTLTAPMAAEVAVPMPGSINVVAGAAAHVRGPVAHGAAAASSAKLVYSWLARRHTCDRCKAPFCDGHNDPGACSFHPGVLFSGGEWKFGRLLQQCRAVSCIAVLVSTSNTFLQAS